MTGHGFPDIFNEYGVRGTTSSLDLLGVLLLIQARRVLGCFAARTHWFMLRCLLSGHNEGRLLPEGRDAGS